jgi:hypothetical protein
VFKVNEDKSIYLTRGDSIAFTVSASYQGESYIFQEDDVVRLRVFEKKGCDRTKLQKDFKPAAGDAGVYITLTGEETKIGEPISKPKDYWYEVELNPDIQPQTIIGYDEDGAKVFRLYPEGGGLE